MMEDIGIGLITNVIYDLGKYLFSKFSVKKNQEKEFQKAIQVAVTQNCPEDVKAVLDSSTYVYYLKSSQFLDLMISYFEYKVLSSSSGKSNKIKTFINKRGTITEKDIALHISDRIAELYIKNEALTSPKKDEVYKATLYILNVFEREFLRSLSPESTQAIIMINSRIDLLQENLSENIDRLREIITKFQENKIMLFNKNFHDKKEEYHRILKDRNSEAHIYLLDKFPFEKFYVPPILKRSSGEMQRFEFYDNDHSEYGGIRCSWNDIFERNNIIYVTGGAGYGKSLFTKKIINNYKELNIFQSEEYIVIYGELKSFYQNGKSTPISVIDFLRESIKRSTLMDVSAEFVEYYLNLGRCIILLDALDEVDKTKRKDLHESVVAFFKNQNPNNKVCITSRERGFLPEKGVEVFKICNLNEEQIEKYVDKIIALKKFEKEDKESFMEQTKLLVHKGFLNSFLVLSLLISIYKAERELPENKLELYQKCFEYIANRREREKTENEFDWKYITPIMKDSTFIELARLGLPNNSNIDRKIIKDLLLTVYKSKFGTEVDAENAIDEFLKFCSDRTELFVPTGDDQFKFFHRSFFEYFYSLYIFLRCNDANEMLAEFVKFDIDSEIFELTVAMLKQKDEMKYQALIELMLNVAAEELEFNNGDYAVLNALILSMQVIDDALYRKRFLDILIKYKKIILKQIDKIHNLHLVKVLFEKDEEAKEIIRDEYTEEYQMYIYKIIDKTFKYRERLLAKEKHDVIEMINEENKEGMFRLWHEADLVTESMDMSKFFYVLICHEKISVKEVLEKVQKDDLIKLYKAHEIHKYKNKADYTLKAVKEFCAFSEDKKQRLLDIMFPIFRFLQKNNGRK